jgi:chemotaxis signal transduction protein
VSIARKPRKGHDANEDVILFSIAKMTFAIAAGSVDEIRNLDGLSPFRPSFATNLKKVTNTLVRDKKDPAKTYFVVNGESHFGLSGATLGRVMVLRSGATAVLVDNIERMAQIAVVHGLPHAFSGHERDWYRGLAICDGRVIPVIREDAFLSKGELANLSAQLLSAIAQGASA